MPPEPVLTREQLVERVHASFSKRFQEEIAIDHVRNALQGIQLADPPAPAPCQLRLIRLVIQGTKILDGEPEPIPIAYSQGFALGVNVILIADNDVGKSSILKTIKFALTGDNGDYDADVKKWITYIRLQFMLDGEPLTISISCRPDPGDHLAVLYRGENAEPPEDMSTAEQVIFVAADRQELEDSLRRFFFGKVGLRRLAWTRSASSPNTQPGDAGTTWLTYFQALQIPDGGDRYLLCDEKHSIGNQEGLILSSFLGLHLVEQLNWLGVEASKQQKLETSTEAERREVAERLGQLETQGTAVNEQLKKLSYDFRQRRESFASEQFQQRIAERQNAIRARLAREQQCSRAIVDISDALSFSRSRAAQIRELIALKLHFTGLDVRLCPNCDADVSAAAIERERHSHHCRLCNKPAHDAVPEELSTRQAEADELAEQVQREESNRESLKREVGALNNEVAQLRQELQGLEAAAQTALSDAIPGHDEQELRDRLLRESGELAAQMAAASRRLEQFKAAGALDANRTRILRKARDVLQDEAGRRNEGLLRRLSELTKEVARDIGAESITDVICSSLGRVTLTKHGESVQFTGIKNQGERMRVKLAFFLAMMQLGSEPGSGRHPGLLLVDQPGSAEMVTEDFRALAEVFHSFDETQQENLQVLCFTARSEFAEATRPEKVYGAQSGKYAF